MTNTGSELITTLELNELPEGMTGDDLLAVFEYEVPPDSSYEMVSGAGVTAAIPRGSNSVTVDLRPGEWLFNL